MSEPLHDVVEALLVDSVGGEVQHLQCTVSLQRLRQLLAAVQVEPVPRHIQRLQPAVDLQRQSGIQPLGGSVSQIASHWGVLSVK